ncbi:MAG TPA: hypothetical protein VGM49_03250 [Candidatus Limnocylindrales bacterium]
MRLPFGLGRRSSSGDGASSDDSDTGFDTGVAAAAPAPDHAWASLPPIQRTTGDMQLVAAPGSFVEGLPGSRGLPPIVQQLGHEVSSLATPGLVVAHARPIDAPTSGAMPAPVQRRATRSNQAAAVAPVQASVAPFVEAPAAEVAEAPANVVVAVHAPTHEAPAPLALPVVAPIRTMPTVSRQSVHVPDRPLTSAASAARPAAVQRAAAAAEAAAAGVAPLSMPVSGGMRRVPSGTTPAMPVVSRQAAAAPDAAPAPASVPATSPAAAPVPSPAMPVAQPAAASAPSTLAQAAIPVMAAPAAPHRLGLGAPMAAVPASARPVGAASPGPVVSRSTTTGPMPIAASNLLPTAQRSAAAELAPSGTAGTLPAPGHSTAARSSHSSAGAPAMPARSAAVQRLATLSHLPVARSAGSPIVAAHSSGIAGSTGSNGSSAAAPVKAPVATVASVQRRAAPEIRPIAAANPIRPSFVLQRSAAESDGNDDADDDGTLPSPWWAPAAESRSGAGTSLGSGFDGGGPAAIQRSASTTSSYPAIARSTAPAGSSASRANATTMLQRSTSAATRPLPPARGTLPDSASRAVATTMAPATASAPSPAIGVMAGPVVQTSPSGASSFGNGSALGSTPTVQREDPPQRPLSQSAGGSVSHASSGTGSGRHHSERELEELAQALFSRIRGRLRNELIHDREAKGLTFDNV